MWKDVLELEEAVSGLVEAVSGLEEAVSGLVKVTTTRPQSTPVVCLGVELSVLSVGKLIPVLFPVSLIDMFSIVYGADN